MNGEFRTDILCISEVMSKEDWKKACPMYGLGYKILTGLYCDHCPYLYDNNGKLCPNNK